MECSKNTPQGPCVLVARHRGDHVSGAVVVQLERLRRIEAAHDGYLRASRRMGASVAAARNESRQILENLRAGTGSGTEARYRHLQGFLEAVKLFDDMVVEEAAAAMAEAAIVEEEVGPTRWGPVSSVEQITTPGRMEP
jgi:hypothetical protein